MKIVIGTLELSLEQATVLALLRIVSSVMTQTQSTSAATGNTPVMIPTSPSAAASDASGSRAIPGLGACETGREESKGESGTPSHVDPVEKGGVGGIKGGGHEGSVAVPMIPMLLSGVTVTLAVDVAAVSVALTEAGAGVAAVTLTAAHSTVIVSTT